MSFWGLSAAITDVRCSFSMGTWGGAPSRSALALEEDVRVRLRAAGLGERAEVVIIDPELEAWVWSDSLHVEESLGWSGATPALRDWLRAEGRWEDGASKPRDPKEAMEAALMAAGIARSTSIYARLASKDCLTRCTDPALQRLLDRLRSWFPLT